MADALVKGQRGPAGGASNKKEIAPVKKKKTSAKGNGVEESNRDTSNVNGKKKKPWKRNKKTKKAQK